jgi:glc operon protein GlcG
MKILSQKTILCGLAMLLAANLARAAELGRKPVITLEIAKEMAQAAEKAALANHWAMVIAVLDDGANLLCLERMDSAPIGSLEVAQKKARSAVIFKAPTKDFADALAKGTTALLKLDILPFEGGIPLVIDGKIVGAIGVSGGARAEQDGQAAKAGADWFQANAK